jgi:hypothetical protein
MFAKVTWQSFACQLGSESLPTRDAPSVVCSLRRSPSRPISSRAVDRVFASLPFSFGGGTIAWRSRRSGIAAKASPLESGAAVTGLFGATHIAFGDYIHTRAWLSADRFSTGRRGERAYRDETEFWRDALAGGRLFETRRVTLEDFVLMDWLPRSPGRYHMPEGERAREAAGERIIERNGHGVVFDPVGKTGMVSGGMGCLRLLMKDVARLELQFLGATSSGYAHRGIVVAVSSDDYAVVAERIADDGGIRCTLSGEVRFWRPDDSLPLGVAVRVPRIYVLVDELATPRRDGLPKLDVTPAVVFTSADQEFQSDGPFYGYAHFDATEQGSLDRAVDWLENSYIGGRYQGSVLTDFDERVPRFDDVSCPISTIMDRTVSLETATKPLQEGVFSQRIALYAQSVVIERAEGPVTNVSITGDGNVVGDNNRVVTTINRGLDREGLRELGETFALLRGEILSLDSLPDKTRNQVDRALADAEDELADDDPDPETVEGSLRRAAETMQAAGETFDAAKGWGKRFLELERALSVVLPAAGRWFPQLIGMLTM